MRKRIGILLVFLMLAVLVGCGAPTEVVAPVQVAAPTQVDEQVAVAEPVDLGPNVSPEMVMTLLDAGDIAVIDVREDYEFADGHIPGAQLIPLGSLQARVDDIPTDRTVILVCRSGNRSGQAYSFLTGQGFDNVHNMTGGMNAWQSAGYEIEK